MFHEFARLVHQRYNLMAAHELFVVDDLDLFETYPAGAICAQIAPITFFPEFYHDPQA